MTMNPFRSVALRLTRFCACGVAASWLCACAANRAGPGYRSAETPSAIQNLSQAHEDRHAEIRSAIERLRQVHLSGYYVGGPHSAMGDIEATRAVAAIGDQIVPYLIQELDRSDFAESAYIVFCLAKLKAISARQRVLKLDEEIRAGRFAAEKPDLTLEVEISRYRYLIAE